MLRKITGLMQYLRQKQTSKKTNMKDLSLAIVQTGPVYLDKLASLEKASRILTEAGEKGCKLVVFGESWFTGYPAWLDFCGNISLWDHPPTKKVFARMLENSISVPGPETELFSEMAQRYGYAVVLGCNERVNGTIYNTALIFDQTGKLAIHHRKLMPTYTEKMVYGMGDGHGLDSVETTFGKLTACICWEHFMPLTRQALHDAGEDVHVALWPNVHEMLQVASRQYAFEGRCFTIAAGQMLHRDQLPAELEAPATDREWLLRGGSAIYAPDGAIELAPIYERDEVIYHTITDMERAAEERMTLDVSGHYNRMDVFGFKVNRERQNRNG